MGTMIAQALAVLHPDQVNRLVLVCCVRNSTG
jgi:pimeloyl-ACP methyl ester carboxylesterase